MNMKIENKVIILFDNDTVGVEKFNDLISEPQFSNVLILKLPNCPEFYKFATIGPNGAALENINGKAVAIECFLDHSSIARVPQVKWTVFNKVTNQYQGELIGKEEYVKVFKKTNLLDGAYDVSKLRFLIDYILTQCHNYFDGF